MHEQESNLQSPGHEPSMVKSYFHHRAIIHFLILAVMAGIEPATHGLTVRRSTAELHDQNLFQ